MMDDITTQTTTNSPFDSFALAIQNRGIPSRLDPFSIDHFAHFESADDIGRPQAIPCDLIAAMEHGDQQQVIRLMGRFNCVTLKSLRTSDGETLLHVAAANGCAAVVERMSQSDAQMPTMVLDRMGRTPLHSVCMAMRKSPPPCTHHLDVMRILLRRTPALVLYMDQQRLTPLEYLHSSHTPHVAAVLSQDNVVERVATEMPQRMKEAHSGRRMSAMETVDRMVNLSGVDVAIMETGFSI